MTKDLTKGEPAKLIFFFTIPLLAGNIFQQLYAFVDTLIVGRFLGVEALAAVGCTGALMFLVLGFIMGFSGGLTIYTGQRFGAGDAAGVRRSCAACVVLSVVIGLIMTTFSVAICRQLLIWMQTPPEIIDGAYSFISIIYLSIPIFVLLQTQSNLLRALGDSRTPTIVMAIGLTTNMILEPLVIGVLGWGIPGAALAPCAPDGLSVEYYRDRLCRAAGRAQHARPDGRRLVRRGAEDRVHRHDAHDVVWHCHRGLCRTELRRSEIPPDRRGRAQVLVYVAVILHRRRHHADTVQPRAASSLCRRRRGRG